MICSFASEAGTTRPSAALSRDHWRGQAKREVEEVGSSPYMASGVNHRTLSVTSWLILSGFRLILSDFIVILSDFENFHEKFS